MAFNLQTFKTRALTAIVFVAIMLGGLLTNYYTFLLLFCIIHVGCWLEYQKLVGLIDPHYKNISVIHKYSIIAAGLCLLLFSNNTIHLPAAQQLATAGKRGFAVAAFVWLLSAVINTQAYRFKNIKYTLLGFLYISVSWALMMWLSRMLGEFTNDGFSRILPMILIASIWINDTMAYIVGSLIGKTPFSSISPKKTWEGTIGGAILAIAIVTLGAYYATNAPVINIAVFAAIAATAGTAGDLLESKIKRLAGVKDSGSLMPGHGGFMDRFDSLLVALPFVCLYVYVTML